MTDHPLVGVDADAANELRGLEPVAAALRQLPHVRPDAADRIVAAALARQQAVRRRPTVWLARAAMLLVAAGIGGAGVWFGRADTGAPGAERTAAPATTAQAGAAAPAPVPATGPAQFASTTTAGDEAPVFVPFALRRPDARRVALVGDFDEWSPAAVPMTRDPSGTWTTTLPLTPGRHAYAFVVDDSTWVTDPRAPLERDPDYGRSHSIVVVGHP